MNNKFEIEDTFTQQSDQEIHLLLDNSSAASLKQRHSCSAPVQRRENLGFLMRPVDNFVGMNRMFIRSSLRVRVPQLDRTYRFIPI